MTAIAEVYQREHVCNHASGRGLFSLPKPTLHRFAAEGTHTDMVLGGVMSLIAVSAIIASSAALPITRVASVPLLANHMVSAALLANPMASAAALPANPMASAALPANPMASAALPANPMASAAALPVAVEEEATGLVDVPLPVAVEEEATGLVDVPWDGELYLFSGLADVPGGSGKEVSATAEYGRHTDEARGTGSHHDMHLFSGHGIDIHLVWRRDILAHAYSKLPQFLWGLLPLVGIAGA
jgi:hypothetical protein